MKQDVIYTIVPETIEGEYIGDYKQEDVLRASWCYLHGKLQYKNGYDIFSLVKKEISEEFRDESWLSEDYPSGIYNCVCYDKQCTFFFWKNRTMHGLVVFNDDKEAYDYAKEQYESKSPSI